jgi:hypothetical protein
MQIVHVVSIPEFPVLSNGALVFSCKSNAVYKEMDKTNHGNCDSIQPPLSAYIGLNLEENNVHHSKERKFLV